MSKFNFEHITFKGSKDEFHLSLEELLDSKRFANAWKRVGFEYKHARNENQYIVTINHPAVLRPIVLSFSPFAWGGEPKKSEITIVTDDMNVDSVGICEVFIYDIKKKFKSKRLMTK